MRHVTARMPLLLYFAALATSAPGQVDVLTAQYETARTSSNLRESVLKTSNVSAATFGRLFARDVDGAIYASPLLVTEFNVPGVGLRDIVIVCTLTNKVYAFDANDPAQSVPYWQVTLGAPRFNGGYFLGPTNGILGTPVIDRVTNTIYLAALIDKSGDFGMYVYALDLSTGQAKFNSPQRMSFTFPSGAVKTDAATWLQRAGLLLSNNVLYVAMADVREVQATTATQDGFIQAFRANDLRVKTGTFQATPTGNKGGIWQAGRGLAADAAGNLFVSTAGGFWNGTTDFGSSVVKLAPSTLSLLGYFTPSNWDYLFHHNLDISANGVTLIPGTNLAFAGGKEGVIYLINRTAPGGLEPAGGTSPVQRFQASQGCGLTDCAQNLSTAFWPHATHPYLFVWDKQDYLRSYPFDPATQRFVSWGGVAGSVRPNRTGGLAVTSLGSSAGTGVLWAYTANEDSLTRRVPGTLRAYDASDVTRELYNSDENPTRDAPGYFVKFSAPVAANGRVYVSTQTGKLQVYGLLCQTNQAANIAVTRGPFRNIPGTNRFMQQLVLTNKATFSIGGPFSVGFASLPSGISLNNARGYTSCAGPAGTPFTAAAAAPLWLKPGQSFSLNVEFTRLTSSGITYTPVVLAGSGAQ